MDRAYEMLRSGDWLSRERTRLTAIALLIASAAGFLFLVVTAHEQAIFGSRHHFHCGGWFRP
jgi:hypothetical protein